MADFDPFANQGGQAAWDPEHANDVKKQAEELSRRIASDNDDPDNSPASFSEDENDELDNLDMNDDDELPNGIA